MREEDIFDRIVSVSWLACFKPWYQRYREMWLYALFGLGTFLINFFVYSFFTEIVDFGVLISNAIAWIFATLYAFFTNRRWVFKSHAVGVVAFFLQIGSFCLGRFLTLLVEEWMLFYLIEIRGLHNMTVKFCSQFIVIALNYLISKLIVFRRRK